MIASSSHNRRRVCPSHSGKDEEEVLPVGGDFYRRLPTHRPILVPVMLLPDEFPRQSHGINVSLSGREDRLEILPPCANVLRSFPGFNSSQVAQVAIPLEHAI